MSYNIFQGNSAEFVVEFLDGDGNITTPSGGTLTLTYTTGVTTASTAMDLSQVGSFFTTTWLSCVADLGPGSWIVQASGSTTIVSTGNIRVVETP